MNGAIIAQFALIESYAMPIWAHAIFFCNALAVNMRTVVIRPMSYLRQICVLYAPFLTNIRAQMISGSATDWGCRAIENKSVYIPQIDGKDLWISNYSSAKSKGYTLLDKNGEPNIKRYRAVFDYSLDLIKLRDVYSKVYRNSKFTFVNKDSPGSKEFCPHIINVTFEYSIKEFNRAGNNIYLMLGWELKDVLWRDCLGYYGSEIVAVQVDVQVKTPVLDSLPKWFYFEDGCYKAKNNIRVKRTISQIRNELYNKGFVCDGIKYVRWKRSSGSARVGKCLFVNESLFSRMRRWELCGLNIRDGDQVDLAALESYMSLTSSSIIDTLQIEPHNILVIDDYESIFYDNVINVTEVDGELNARPELAKISNNIWDGQSILDRSAMGKYKNKGMLLLRNRFFKSCCFNGNIQLWFKDNGITSIDQLNGFTLAQNVEDIKLITTPSSIKYLKFDSLEKWLSLIDDTFGIVKYDKPTHFMDGKLVQTHYQLINTIQMSKPEIKELLQPTFDFMTLIRHNPAVLRYWIKFNIEDEIEVTPVKSKTDVVYKMMSVNSDFCKTKLYYDFKTDFLKSFTKDLKCGRVLVNGNYSTLCGNPIEMLLFSISKFSGVPIMNKHTAYSKRFEFGKDLLGSRSPHPAISNVLLVKNRHYDLIDRYMNPTNEIVYINSINENILQKLAGCDFDSDSILLTDNEVLIEAAKRNDGRFKVAVCNVPGTKRKRKFTNQDKADLDMRTSNNLIGDIINLAQEITTDIWNKLYEGASFDEIFGLYLETCKLSILSGIEIDKAKKEFVIDSAREISKIRLARKENQIDNKSVKPKFFAHIAKQKGYYNPQRKAYINHHTSMDYLQQCVNAFRLSRNGKTGKNEFISFSETINYEGFNYDNVYDKQVSSLLDSVYSLDGYISNVYKSNTLSKSEKFKITSAARQEFVETLGTMEFNRDTMLAILKTIEKPENKKYHSLLFYSLFGYPNTSFYRAVKQSQSKIEELSLSPCGEFLLFGTTFQTI